MEKQKKVALLTLNYNSKQFLEVSVTSLLNQTYKNFEIFVIDNLSTDGSVEFLRERFPKTNYPKVNIISHTVNGGVGKGFNKVIKKIYKNYDYIGILDQDVKVDRNWLKECISTLEKDPNNYICCPITYNWDGTVVDNVGGAIINILAGIFVGFLGDYKKQEIPEKYVDTEFKNLFAVATAMVVKTQAFEEFGFYDEDYFIYFEEFDFSWRIVLGGKKVMCNTKALAYHYGHGSKYTKKVSLLLLKVSETNLFATYVKNLSLTSILFLIYPLLLFRILFSLFYLAISPGITLAKLEGIGIFLKRWFTGQYGVARKFVSTVRKKSDIQVLSLNPNSIFSVSPIFSAAISWFRTIGRFYNKAET